MSTRGKKTSTKGPSKKSSGAGSSSIKDPFVNDEARKRYRDAIVNRKCIAERGFHNPMRGIYSTIMARQWGKLTKQPDAALVPVVREFYANAVEHDNFQVSVRGKLVSFDSKVINRYYELPNIPECEYSQLLEQPIDHEEIISVLAHSGAKWIYNKSGPAKFEKGELQVTAKVWHYFICGKLMPTYHVSHVSRERAILNYAIQKTLSIDVGVVIQNSILTMALATSHVGGFGHPSLIYELCRRAGVPTSPEEEIQHPKPPITAQMIRRLGKSVTPYHDSSDDEDDSSQQPGPNNIASRPSTSGKTTKAPPLDPDERYNALKSEMTEVKKMVTSMNRRMNQFFNRQEQQFNHLLQIQYATVAAFPTTSGQPFQFPAPPEFSHISPAYEGNDGNEDNEADAENEDDENNEEEDDEADSEDTE